MASKVEDTYDTSMKYKVIRTKVSECGGIFSIIINRPKKLNAVSFEAMHEIRHYIENHVNPYSSGAKCVVFYGEGKHFTSGLDLNSAKQIGELGGGDTKDIGGAGEMDVARKAARIYDHVFWL